MPRKSSHSVRHDAVPLDRVLAAAATWVKQLKQDRPEVVRVGYYGSYARGDYVPGSDFDVLVEVRSSDIARLRDRNAAYLPESFPVGVELFVYTTQELERLRTEGSAFITAIDREMRSLA